MKMTRPELEDFRKELIQTAAVIVSALEDIDYGVAHHDRLIEADRIIGVNRFQSTAIWDLIYRERRRQDEKWGPQHHRIADWLAIIGEEYGEACMAYVDDLLMPKILGQKGIEVDPPKPVQWGEPKKLQGLKEFLAGAKPVRVRVDESVLVDRGARRMRGEVLDPLVYETDETDDYDSNEGRYDRQD